MNYPIRQQASGILYREIDNPGRGNCGFYAFAIGLINIIQNEIVKGNINPKQLKVLNQHAEKGNQYTANDFMKFDFNQQTKSDRQLLERMQADLRKMLHKKYLEDLHYNAVIIEGTNKLKTNNVNVYIFFLELVKNFFSGEEFDENMNFLCLSEDIEDFASALAYKIWNDKMDFESAVQNAFLFDLYGNDYQKKVEVPWNQDFADNGFSAEESQLLVQFKQFSMVVYDYYDYSCSTRQTNLDSELKTRAENCAKAMQNLHQKVIISVGDDPIAQENLVKGTLYIQIVSINPAAVRVYSSILDKAYNYSTKKAVDLLRHVQYHFPKWDYKNTKTLISSEKRLFGEFVSSANETLRKEYFSTKIQKEFSQIKKQDFKTISKLLDSNYAKPLELERKQFHNYPVAAKLALEVEESSIILQAMSNIKSNDWLATYADLNCLADLTGVALRSLENGCAKKKHDYSDKPIVTVNNLSNYHWTTQIQVAYFGGETATKYAGWVYENLPLTKAEIKKILLTYTTGFVAFFGRNHQKKAEDLIAQCDDNEVSLADLMKDFRNYMSKLSYDPKSSFLKRFEYLNARYRSLENDSFSKKDIEKVFANYALTGCFRNHLAEAHRIIVACKNPKNEIDAIIDSIERYVENNEFNEDSHFLRCFNQVLGMMEAYDEGKQPRLI